MGAPQPGPAGAPRLVEVAVDATAGTGPRTYTYAVPAALAPVGAGEAVLVPFGRGGRQVLGIVLGAGEPPAGAEPRELSARVRADGPLLHPLGIELARRIAARYLAPVAAVVRAMLPPGLLERVELVAELTPAGEARLRAAGEDADGEELAVLDALAGRPRAVRELGASDGRPALLRRLRSLEAAGACELAWTLAGAGAGPRYERRIALTEAGRTAAAAIAGGGRTDGRPLGTRQRAILEALAAAEAPRRTAVGEAEAAVDRSGGDEAAALAADDGWVAAEALAVRHDGAALASLVRRGLLRSETHERPRRPLGRRAPGLRGARPAGVPLSAGQAAALEVVARAIAARDPRPLLLDGVTGGGRTALYAEAIAASLDAGRPVLLLVPEVTLALPVVDRLRADLAVRVALLHSGLTPGERLDEWRRIRAGAVDVVVGTRTAVLAPLADVGLVVVDEEHDGAYKSDRTPRLQARDVAVELARLAGAAVILGSATPSVESMGRALDGTHRRATLPDRPVGRLPAVTLVDLRAELATGNRGLISGALAGALLALDTGRGDRAILVINRRGSASVVLCRDCGAVQACGDCDRPVVFHQAGSTLRCHHCGRAWPPAPRCPACASPRIRHLGGGTERVEREVRALAPRLRVGRLDRDVAERRGAAERILDDFGAGRLDVLVGTSLVAKGLDVPEVTLVGVVSADIALNLPDERAPERTYQLLAQAVGRAGRGERPGRAIVQTYRPDHRAIRAVVEHDPASFYAEELELRRRFGSPPYGRLVKLTCALEDRGAAEQTAGAYAERLRRRAAELALPVVVAGPVPAYVARRADRWRFNLVLRGADPVALLEPVPGPPWSIDVDPESLL